MASPYRAPCSSPPDNYGWGPQHYGPCFAHARLSEKNVAQWNNVTLVNDYRCPPGGTISGSGCCDGACTPDAGYHPGGIAPYCRFSDAIAPACSGPRYCSDTPGGPWCNSWQAVPYGTPYGLKSCSFTTEADHNCFKATGSNVDISVCRKIGFKNIQAWKAWHGRFGYQSHQQPGGQVDYSRTMGFGTLTSVWIAGVFDHYTDTRTVICNAHDIELEQTSFDTTKYLVESASMTYSYTDTRGTSSASGSISATVNRYSGVITYGCSLSGTPGPPGDVRPSAWGQLTEQQNCPNCVSGGTCVSAFQGVPENKSYALCVFKIILDTISQGNASSPGSYNFTVSKSGTSLSLNCTNGQPFSSFQLGPIGANEYIASVDTGTGSGTIDIYGWTDPPTNSVWGVVSHEVITMSNTSVTHSLNTTHAGSFAPQTTAFSVTATLSTTYSSSDVQSDANTARNQWDLSNDHIYPYRTDSLVGVAPVCHYNEVFGNVAQVLPNPAYSDPIVCPTDPNASLYDGSLKGAPINIPAAAMQRGYFSWKQIHYRVCCPSSVFNAEIYAYGAFAGEFNASVNDFVDSVVPKTATEWTQNIVGSSWQPCGPGTCSDGWWGQQLSPGYNSAGAGQLYTTLPCSLSPGSFPGGGWRFNLPGGIFYLQDWVEVKIPRPSIDFFRPCGNDRYAMDETTVRCVQSGATLGSVNINSATAINSGDLVWVCGVSGITAGVYTATKVTATNYSLVAHVFAPGYNYTGDCSGSANGIMGKLKWSTAWPICGRLAVVSSVTTTVTTAVNLLATGDKVDIQNAAGSVVASNQTVTVVNSTTFTIPTDLTGLGATWVVSNGAPAYYWEDSAGKGEYAYASWTMNLRDFQERERALDQYAACGSCADATPVGLTHIRYNQWHYHGMPQAVSVFSPTQHCLPFNTCEPQKLIISSNGSETWAQPMEVQTPPTLTLDDRYGAMWQGAFVQSIEDPFYDARMVNYGVNGIGPHKVCASCSGNNVPSSCFFDADDGSCEADTCTDDCLDSIDVRFFAHPPLVENCLAVPAGAPALPAGVYIGYLTLASLDTSGAVAGNILVPPEGQGYTSPNTSTIAPPLAASTPWGVFLAEAHCVCIGGRFSAAYQANGAGNLKCP